MGQNSCQDYNKIYLVVLHLCILMFLKLFPQSGGGCAVRRYFIIARVFSSSVFVEYHWGCTCELFHLHHFSFLPHPVHCPYQNRQLLIANQKPEHFTAVLSPCCGPPSHSWNIEASTWMLCNYISYSILCPFWCPLLLPGMGECLSFSLPFLIMRIKTGKLEQKYLWCRNLCLSLRKFLENYLSWICW